MELVSMLREHLDFIALSARAFDAGAEGEAKRLAVSIAALVHDTKASHSLLDQLGIKEELRFIDSATPIGSSDSGPDAEGVSTMRIDLMGCGLTIMATGGGEVRWEAPLDAGSSSGSRAPWCSVSGGTPTSCGTPRTCGGADETLCSSSAISRAARTSIRS